MTCKYPPTWCYQRPDCRKPNGPESQVDGAPPLPSNGPKVIRLEHLLRRQAELAERLAKNERAPYHRRLAVVAAARLVDDAIYRVSHEDTPLDWRRAI